MYTLTYITKSGKLESISHPTQGVIIRAFMDKRKAGLSARVWGKKKELIF